MNLLNLNPREVKSQIKANKAKIAQLNTEIKQTLKQIEALRKQSLSTGHR